jgi:hypothetical protein
MLESISVIAWRQAADLTKGRTAVSAPVSRSAAGTKIRRAG